MNDNSLTKNEKKILKFIQDKKNWRRPTIEEIRKYIGFKSSSYVHKIVKKLESKKLI